MAVNTNEIISDEPEGPEDYPADGQDAGIQPRMTPRS